MRRSTLLWGSGVGVVAMVSGCASLLGDFTANGESGGDDGGPGTLLDGSPGTIDVTGPAILDGGGDGNPGSGDDGPSTGDGEGPLDAAPDAEAFLLTCAFALVNPIQIESLEGAGNPFYNNPPLVAGVDDQEVEILERGENGQWTMFWLNPKSLNNPVTGEYSQPLGDNGGNVQNFGRVTGGTALMTQGGLLGRTDFSLKIFEDNIDQPGNPPSGGTTLTPGFVGANDVSAAFAEVTPLDYVWTVSSQANGADASTVYAGQTYPDGGIVSATLFQTQMHGGSPVVLHDGTFIHVYMSSSPDQGGTLAFRVADDGTGVDGGGTPRVLDVDGGLPSLLVGATEAVGGPNFAFVDVDLSNGIGATFRVGQVPSSNLGTFLASDIPAGLVISDGRELPISNGSSGWFGNQFAMVGSGQPIAANGGINFIWYDSQGHLRADRRGATALLTGHTSIDGMGIALDSALGSLVSWHLVWSEQAADADGGGFHDVLFYQSLACN